MKKRKVRKEVRFRNKLIIKIARFLVGPFLRFRYNFKSKYYRELKGKGPYVVVANHVVSVDVMLLGLAMPFNLYYFATENLFNLGFLSKLLVFAANPIKKSKSKSDLKAIRKARKIAQEGGSIAVFPEGNLTYTGETKHFDKSLVKLIRLLKLPVILYRFEGLYLSNPRWSVFGKKGKSTGEVTRIMKYDEYKDISDEELYKIVYEGIYTNAYDDNIDATFTGVNMAVGLERLVFMDLKANKPFVNYAENNKLRSNYSDFELTYYSDGRVEDNNKKVSTLIDIDLEVIKSYYNYYHSDKQLNYINKALLNKNVGTKRIKLGNFDTSLNKTSVSFSNNNELDLEIKFQDMDEMAIQGKNKIILYCPNETYLIHFDHTVSVYAYLLTYQFYKRGMNKDGHAHDYASFGL